MPALTWERVTDSGNTTTSSTSYVSMGCETSALAAGRWLIIGQANHRNQTGSGPATCSSEVELRYGTTRLAVSRWCTTFGGFNTSDTAAGGALSTFAVVDTNGTDTVSFVLRRDDGSPGDTVLGGNASIIAILLDDLVEGVDYFTTEVTTGDVPEVVTVGTSWVEGDVDGQLTVTPASTEDFAVLAYTEGLIFGTPGATEVYRTRFRVNGAAAGTEIETQVGTFSGVPGFTWPTYFELETATLTASTPYEFLWEFANDTAGQACAFRRSRILALRLDAFNNWDYITNAGGMSVDGGTGSAESTQALSFNFSSADALILSAGSYQAGTSDWGQVSLREEPGNTDYPTDGRMWAFLVGGSGGSNDISTIGFAHAYSTSGAVSWRHVVEADSSTASPYTFGRNQGDSADTTTPLLALELATASATGAISGTAAGTSSVSGTVTGSGRVAGTSAGTATATGTVVGYGRITGTSFGVATVTGTLSGIGRLSGVAAGTSFAVWRVPVVPDVDVEESEQLRLWSMTSNNWALRVFRLRAWGIRSW